MKTCNVEGCVNPHRAKGLCHMHGMRLRRHGTVDLIDSRSGPKHGRWAGEEVSYAGCHLRLKRKRGPATDMNCAECGVQASHWAYTHDCPNEKQSNYGPYSTDMDRYQPMCLSCHKRFDLWHKRNAGLVLA